MATCCWNMASLRSSLPLYSAATSNSYPRSNNTNTNTTVASLGNRNVQGRITFSVKPTTASASASSSRFRPRASFTFCVPSLSTIMPFNTLPLHSGLLNPPEIESRFQMMRHGRKVPKLGRPADQRKALLRGLTTQLLRHGRIRTTRARAKAMRKWVDKMITLAKKGSLHHRRQALAFIYDKQLVHALFAEVGERYGDRNGGYTRILRNSAGNFFRRGDAAPMVFIELV